MFEFARNLFLALLVETIVILLAIILKDDKRKMAIALIVGTMTADLLGFLPTLSKVIQASTSEITEQVATLTVPPTDIPFIPAPSLTPPSAAGTVMVGMKLHYVPAGPFTMGDETYDDDKPIHEVTLDAFWIDETEVTNKMYTLCVKDAKCQSPSNKSSYTRKNY